MPFDTARYQSLRRSHVVGIEVVHREETGSTMDDARAGAEVGGKPGTAYVGAAQTSGRGRLGRGWVSEPGAGLWVTYHLRMGRGAPLASLAGGLAVVEAIEATAGLTCVLKWPNDVQYNGRKICGVLTEAHSRSDGFVDVFLGMGTNLRTPSGLDPQIAATATSIEQEGRPAPAREVLLAGLSSALERRTQQAERDPEGLVEDWRGRLVTLGQRVRLTLPDGTLVEGEAADVDATGALILDVAGWRRTFAAGEVTSARPAD